MKCFIIHASSYHQVKLSLLLRFFFYREEFRPVHNWMLQVDGTRTRTYHDASAAIITFAGESDDRMLTLLRIRNHDIALADICTGIAADTQALVKDQWSCATWDHGNLPVLLSFFTHCFFLPHEYSSGCVSHTRSPDRRSSRAVLRLPLQYRPPCEA